jgi:hypothetical protein
MNCSDYMENFPNTTAKSLSHDMEDPSTSPSKYSVTSSSNYLQREGGLVTKVRDTFTV